MCGCESELKRVPHTISGHGWLWSRENPPDPEDAPAPGKWMLFPACAEAIDAWCTVATAADAGTLWCAKVAARALGTTHLICIYTPDFRDLPVVEHIAHRLNDLGVVRATMYYKPDIFTEAGIYRRSRGGRRIASIYEYQPETRHMRSTPGLQHAQDLLTRPRHRRR